MANWPSTLPGPIASGYQVQPEMAFSGTQMESGPKRYRQRFSDVPEQVQFAVRLDAAQMVIFRDFWRNTIHMGADWFTCDKIDLGDGIGSYTVHAASKAYTAARLSGGKWEVSFPIEVRNA